MPTYGGLINTSDATHLTRKSHRQLLRRIVDDVYHRIGCAVHNVQPGLCVLVDGNRNTGTVEEDGRYLYLAIATKSSY